MARASQVIALAISSLGSENMGTIETTILKLAAARAPKTICPSEVAHALDAADWRLHMLAVREAAQHLVDAGQIICTQRGKPASPITARGPVRLALPAREVTLPGVP